MNLKNYNALVANQDSYLKNIGSVFIAFGGPSVYFHEKALEYRQKEFLSDRHLEYVYATLVSWGMHRMGSSGAKMPDFKIFQDSVLKNVKELNEWKDLRIEKLTRNELDNLLPRLETVCFSLCGSNTDSKVVSATKILAHILPDLVCPMDRNYTLDFFHMSLNSEEKERRFFRTVMIQMWKFFNVDTTLSDFNSVYGSIFSKSYPKIFDNLIIAYKRADIKNLKIN